MNRSAVLIFTAACICILSTGCTEAPRGMAIENVTVVDPLDGARPGMRVVVESGQIVAVDPMTEPGPAGMAAVDGTDRFLIPGLWDMHVHFLYEPALTDLMPDLFLDYGITSVRDTGGNLTEMAALAERLTSSRKPAPNLYYAGPLLDGRLVVYDGGDPGRPELGISVPDPKAAREAVAEVKAAGASFIKIYELVDPDVYTALADAANDANLPIASHVPLALTAETAGPRADSMEHLRNLELACASDWQALLETRRQIMADFTEGRGAALRSNLHNLQRIPAINAYDETRCDEVMSSLTGTIQVPTLRLNTVAIVLPFQHEDWPDALAELPGSVRRRWQSTAEEMAARAPVADSTFSDWSLFLISRLQSNGVPIGAGTDTPIGIGIPGWSLHTELELLVRAGLTPLEAIEAATVQAARFLRIEDRVGRILPGMAADLVLLDGDPLADIRNTRKISAVMLGGEWVR